MSGLLCHVTWNNHSSTFLTYLGSLHLKDSLCDATIACSGKYYPVHQLVLSSCSEYFEEIFTQIKCKHPFVIIKGMKPVEFEALLNYMYKGEVNVPEDKLSDLIKAAEELRVKGLSAPDHSPDELPIPVKQIKRNAPLYGPSPLIKRRKENWVPSTSPTKLDDSNMKDTIHMKTSFIQDVVRLEEEFHNPDEVQGIVTVPNEGEVSFTSNNIEKVPQERKSTPGCESLQREVPVITKYLQEDSVPARVIEEVILPADDRNTSDKKDGNELASKASCKRVQGVPISSSTGKINSVTSPVQNQHAFALPPLTVSTTACSVSSITESSANTKNLNKESKEINKNKLKVKAVKKLSSSTSSPGKTKALKPSTVSISKQIESGVQIAGKIFPSINPMVKLNVDEYLRAVEEMERVKARNKDESATFSDSVVHVSDSETSSEFNGSFCSEGKMGGKKEEDTVSLELQFSTARRASHLSSQSDHEDLRSDGESRSSHHTSERKGSAKGRCKMLQLYNLNHIPLNNIFTYRVFRNLNLFIECLLKDNKKEDAFGRSLISAFKSYLNYNLVSDIIAPTLAEQNRDSQGRWIQKLATLDPPVLGRHVHLDAQTSEVLFSNDVIPALMVMWQFRVLINKHGLIKDLKPGFTSSPRHKFLLGIKQSSSFFQKEQLCIFKNNLRNFYRFSLKGK